MKKNHIIEQFIENNNLGNITDSLIQMLIRDMKAHPELYNNSDQEEDVIQAIRFINNLNINKLSKQLMDQHEYRLELEDGHHLPGWAVNMINQYVFQD